MFGTNYRYQYSDAANGNALTRVEYSEASGGGRWLFSAPYVYDKNGNLTYDGLDMVNISYNAIGLPERIFDDNGEIRYIYSASGDKLASIAKPAGASAGSVTYYRTVMVYSKPANSKLEQLQYVIHPEGIVSYTPPAPGSIVSLPTYAYNYFKKDHVGSTRVLLAGSTTARVLGGSLRWSVDAQQYTNYYPFGLAWQTNNLDKNRYLFSGKEIQDAAVGAKGMLNLYDFGSRFYNPTIGRWFNLDPKLQTTNPYLYCANNPGMYVDPDGEFWHIIVGAIVGGVANVVANWDSIDGFVQGLSAFGLGAGGGAIMAATGGAAGVGTMAMIGTGAAVGATTAAGNSIIGQTGENFRGIENVDWGAVGQGAATGAFAGAAGAGIGTWAANASNLTSFKGFTSPLLRSATISAAGAVPAHIAGGTAYGLMRGQGIDDAFKGSFDGLGRSVLMSVGTSVASTLGTCYAYGINPVSGNLKALPRSTPKPSSKYGASADGDNVTLYRGMTGREDPNRPLYMTDDKAYAAQYGDVQSIKINRSIYNELVRSCGIETKQGMHVNYMNTGGSYREIIINDPGLRNYILNNIQR